MSSKLFHINGIGEILISKRSNSKHIKIRIVGSKVTISIPKWVPYKMAVKYAEKKKHWIIENTRVKTRFKSGLKIGKQHQLIINRSFNELIRTKITTTEIRISIPNNQNLLEDKVQLKIKKACEKALLYECEDLLTDKISELSALYNLEFNKLSFKRMKSRWGSCDANKNITINTHIIQLPYRIIEYVLIHELAHTKHMNHGSDFWQLIEKCIPDYKNFKKQLKTYAPEVLIS